MNLRGIANSAIQTINPDIPVTLYIPNGYTVDPDTRKQVPQFLTESIFCNVQALDGDELKQIDKLNIQSTVRGVYLRGSIAGVIKPDQQPSAVLEFAHGGVSGKWGVITVLEQWQNWCKVAVVYQVAT